MKFVHTNIVARDWRGLARFYADVFGCEILLPERDLAGEWLDRLRASRGPYPGGAPAAPGLR